VDASVPVVRFWAEEKSNKPSIIMSVLQ